MEERGVGLMGTFTPAQGFGMLAVGLAVMFIGGIVGYIIINKIQKSEQEKEKQKREERRSWI